MSKRRRPRGPKPELRPEHARPLDPATFIGVVQRAMAASQQPHYRLHERVSPHVILRDADEVEELRLTDKHGHDLLYTSGEFRRLA
jgi:hypothetical protein